MRAIVHTLFLFFAHIGAFGLLILGVLDSSFLFLPLGNDLLLIALTVRHHTNLPLYVAMAAGGSTLGCYLLDLSVRKGGGAGLKMVLSPKRLRYVEKKVEDRAAAALLVATLAPPPFPFTLVIAAASALHYSRGKMLGIIATGRVVRFTIIGSLAIWLGRHILKIAQTPAFEWSMAGFIALCVLGQYDLHLQLGPQQPVGWPQTEGPRRSAMMLSAEPNGIAEDHGRSGRVRTTRRFCENASRIKL